VKERRGNIGFNRDLSGGDIVGEHEVIVLIEQGEYIIETKST